MQIFISGIRGKLTATGRISSSRSLVLLERGGGSGVIVYIRYIVRDGVATFTLRACLFEIKDTLLCPILYLA